MGAAAMSASTAEQLYGTWRLVSWSRQLLTRGIMSTNPQPGADGKRVVGVFSWEKLVS